MASLQNVHISVLLHGISCPETIERLRNNGSTPREIAFAVGVSEDEVIRAIRNATLANPDTPA